MKPDVYILLPVHNRIEITALFVDCLRAQSFKNYQLVLIDDGSNDGTEEMVKAQIANLTVLKGEGDWWWAGSLQQGLDWLKKQHLSNDTLILFINDDVCFAADYLERARRVMANKKGVLVLSQYLAPGSKNIIESGIFANLRNLTFMSANAVDKINCLSTRGLFVHWQDVKVIGGFHPKLLPHYLSDYEYTLRAYRRGLKCETSPQLLIEPEFETTGYRAVNEKRFLKFLKKYFSKKSAANPIYWTSFVLLATPASSVPINLTRVWYGAGKAILRALSAGIVKNK